MVRVWPGYREYADGTANRIRLVKHLQSLGLRLDDIVEVLGTLDAGTASCANQRPRFEAVVARIDDEIATLRATRRKIVRLLRRCEAGRCTLGGIETQRLR
jgi:DNA-binding transcriptional MerR regulator